MQKLLFITTTLVAVIANAASDAHHGGGIPVATIGWQVFNLTIVFGIIYYFTRKTIPEIFRQRQETYLHSAKKAEQAKLEAEKQYNEIKHRLENLQSTKEESLARATAEAADLKRQILKEAQDQTKRIKDEASVTVKIELQKAKRDLHEKFVKESVGMARQVLSKDIGSSDHQKLQSEFARNIEAVSP